MGTRATTYKEKLLRGEAETIAKQLILPRVKETIRRYSRTYPKGVPHEFSVTVTSLAQSHVKEILENTDNWPEWFHKMVQEEVNHRVQAGIDKRFDDRVKQGIEEGLAEKKRVEWPRYVREHIDPFVKQDIIQKLRTLNNSILTMCNQCGTNNHLMLTPEMISDLFRTGQFRLICSNPLCRDRSGNIHEFEVYFYDIIAQLTSEFIKVHLPKDPEDKEDEEKDE